MINVISYHESTKRKLEVYTQLKIEVAQMLCHFLEPLQHLVLGGISTYN